MPTALRISEAASLALHATVLFLQNPGRPLQTRAMAEAIQCSSAHLSKVLQQMARAGFVAAVRGPKGGYLLARSEKKLSLLAILEAMDGPVGEGGCLLSPPLCDGHECVFGALSTEVTALVRKRLSETTVDELKTRKRIPLP
jgi:Rrf2 family protein